MKIEYCPSHIVVVEKLEEQKRDMETLHQDLNWIKGLMTILICAIVGVNAL